MSVTNWKITNSITSGGIKLVLFDVYTDQDAPDGFFYEQTLNPISSSSSQRCISPGGFEIFPIPPVHRNEKGDTVDYTFIIAMADTLAPVASVSCKADTSDLPANYEVTDDTVKYINNVYDFYENISAFPTSELAIDFADVMNGGTESEIQAFFNNTQDYKNVKIDDVLLVQSYYKALPYGWCQGKYTKFYLYSQDYQNNTDTDKPIGEVNITNDWSDLPLPVIPDPKKFKTTLKTNRDDKTINIEFKNGTFWDSIKTDTPKIGLSCLFAMPSQFTMDDEHNNIEICLAGTINGYDVFGVSEKAPHDQDGKDGFSDVMSPETFKDYVDLVMYFITLGMGIGFLVSCYYAGKYLYNRFKSDDTLATEEETLEIRKLITANDQRILELIENNNQRVTDLVAPRVRRIQPRNIRFEQEQARARLLDAKTRQAKGNIQRMVDAQTASLETIGNRFANNQTADIMDGLDRIQGLLDGGLVEFRAGMADITQNLTQYNEIIRAGKANVNNRLSGEERQAFDNAQAAYDASAELQEVTREEMRQIEEGRDVRQEEGGAEIEVVAEN
jgi:hypothetical protein